MEKSKDDYLKIRLEDLKKEKLRYGAGTMQRRFLHILEMLEERYPDPEYYSSSSPEIRYIEQIDKQITDNTKMREALEDAIVALDDWMNIYASEFCDADRVAEARKRLSQDGSLYYIATVLQ